MCADRPMRRRAGCALLLALASAACSTSGFNHPIDMPPPEVRETPSGVRYQNLLPGSGLPAVFGSFVRVHYIGWLSSGEQFDSSYERGNPIEFTIGKGEVIRGWEDGMLGMRKDGKRRLTIPAELAYGDQGVPGMIPPNSEIVLEVTLVEVAGP